MNILQGDDFLGSVRTRHTAGAFSFGHWIAAPCGDAVRPHAHADPHFMFVVAGRYRTGVGGEGPDLIYNPPDTVHRDRFESRGSFFAVSISRREAEKQSLPLAPMRIGDGAAYALMNRLMRECASWTKDSALVAETLCFELLGCTSGASLDRVAPRWLRVARDFVDDQFDRPITIEQIAHAVGVHPIHLTRTFRKFYRCTPGDFIRMRRARCAAELLTQSSKPLAEVALDSGFADQSHFTRLFRRAYGVAPGEYRRLTRQHG